MKQLKDTQFLLSVWKIAYPIAFLAIIQSLLGIVDQVMLGRLGEAEIAGAGLGMKPVSIYSTLIYAVAAGASIFIAQYWGDGERKPFKTIIEGALSLCVGIALISIAITLTFSEKIIGFFTKDTEVILVGDSYQKIITLSYLPIIFVAIYSSVFRCIDLVKVPMYAGFVAVACNTFLNWVLIFGNLGAPALGVEGAASATVAARAIEMSILAWFIWKNKTYCSFNPAHVIFFTSDSLKKLCKVTLPIVYTYITFTVADVLYSAIYGNMGTKSIVAINIIFPIQGFIIAFFTGISSASGIMVGQKLGSNRNEEAYQQAIGFLGLGFILPILIVLLLLPLYDLYLSLYNVSDDVIRLSKLTLYVMSFYLWVKVSNMILMSGILPSGGQTKTLFYINLVAQWGISLPLGYFAAFVMNYPVHWVFFFVTFEELLRWAYCLYLVKQRRWMVKLS